MAVFDYGDMHLGNHIGWDFVKMETELKVRVYADLFPSERRAFVREVHSFELRLVRRTENVHHKRARAEDDPESDPDLEQLARILLEIRRLASLSLGHDRYRPDCWLEEYYFLLACYGAYALRFAPYGISEFLAAYASAGTAACRLSFSWKWLLRGIGDAKAEAGRLISDPQSADAEALCRAAKESQTFTRVGSRLGHHAQLSFLREWARVDAKSHGVYLVAAMRLLRDLRELYPHALEIVEVLLLVLLQQNDLAAVEGELADLYRRHIELPYEIECRLGRVLKDRGVKAWPADQPRPEGQAAVELRQSLLVYERAWLQSRNYYPGGNVAGLLVLLGHEEAARDIAKKVLVAAREVPTGDLWGQIAQADMLYILGQDDEAARSYAEVRSRCKPQQLESSLRQLDLLLRIEPGRRDFWNSTRLIASFGSEAVHKIDCGSNP